MNSFLSRYKNSKKGVTSKQQTKDEKKSITKALHQTFKLAMEGQMAGIEHLGIQYFMMRQDIFNSIVQSGGKILITEEQKDFHQHYLILLNIMQSLNIEDDKESALHDEIDQFTFEFSQYMNDQKATKKRKEILKKFNEFIKNNELLTQMNSNFRDQIFATENPEKPIENKGKLT